MYTYSKSSAQLPSPVKKKHKTSKAILNTIIFRGVCVPSRGKNLKGKSKK
jgi:hypothetical protein